MPGKPGQPEKRVTVTILGEDYILSGGDSETYMKELAATVDERLARLVAAHPKLPVSKIAVLMALNLADEYQRLKKQHDELMRNIAGAR